MKSHNTKLAPRFGLVAALVLGVCGATQAQEKPNIKEVYEGDFLIGAAINGNIARAGVGQEMGGRGGGRGRAPESVASDVDAAKKYYNSISPENDLKWQLIHPNPGPDGYNFGPADAFVEFGEANDMYIVGHTLVWHSQTPGWVFETSDPEAIAEFEANQPEEEEEVAAPAGRGRGRGGFGGFGRGRGPSGPPATREELLARMRDHIHTVVGRYKGRIHSWDVVNEALSDGGGEDYLRNSPWRRIIGDDFIAKAFEYAHEADPDAILRYNDYGLENPEKIDKLIKLVTQLKEQGVPIHAIGTQAHMNVSNADFDYMDASLTKIATLGLPIHVTELDINGAVGGQRRGAGADISQNAAQTQGGLVSEADERLSASYKGVFEAFMKHKDVLKVVTFWGVNDAVSWRANGAPLLFDGDNNPKPAYDTVIAVKETATSAE